MEESVRRLRSVVIPRFSIFGLFKTGLYGDVDVERVRVAWRKPWFHNAFQPWFIGRFGIDAGQVQLAGVIGPSRWVKAIFYS